MSNVLVFSPHFDDESIGCGGSIIKHVRAGDAVKLIFMTTGNSGSTLEDRDLDPAEYDQLRKAEATQAAKVLGLEGYECLEQLEGFMQRTAALEERLVSIIREIRPDIVYIPHEDENHNDHVVTALAVQEAIERARWTYFPRLGVEPHAVSEIRAYEIWTPIRRPNLYIDISDVIAIKEQAIKCYESQLLHLDHYLASRGLNQYRGLTGAGVPFAEAFRREMVVQCSDG